MAATAAGMLHETTAATIGLLHEATDEAETLFADALTIVPFWICHATPGGLCREVELVEASSVEQHI